MHMSQLTIDWLLVSCWSNADGVLIVWVSIKGVDWLLSADDSTILGYNLILLIMNKTHKKENFLAYRTSCQNSWTSVSKCMSSSCGQWEH